MAERHALLDAIDVGGMHGGRAAEGATTLGVLALKQVPFAGAGAQYLATGGNLEPFRRRFLGLDAFGTSHKKQPNFESKRARNIGTHPA